jgi:hypothetical protein
MLRKPVVAAVTQRMCISIGCNIGVIDTATGTIAVMIGTGITNVIEYRISRATS